MFNWRTKLLKLLCLKCFGSTSRENSVMLQTMNDVPVYVHVIKCWYCRSPTMLICNPLSNNAYGTIACHSYLKSLCTKVLPLPGLADVWLDEGVLDVAGGGCKDTCLANWLCNCSRGESQGEWSGDAMGELMGELDDTEPVVVLFITGCWFHESGDVALPGACCIAKRMRPKREEGVGERNGKSERQRKGKYLLLCICAALSL